MKDSARMSNHKGFIQFNYPFFVSWSVALVIRFAKATHAENMKDFQSK